MSEKKKKKSSWLSLLRRDPSSRHSMIETGSERNLDKSLDDVSPIKETPGTVTHGSLDRLTALNSKPPKSGFFYLKPKTPAFWKPLFPNSSSSQLISTPKKSQLVQTDSPTQTSTTDFGVQAVIVGRSAHTRDVLVQTCPAWEDRPTLGDGLATGNSDPNKGRETVNNGSGLYESHPLESEIPNSSEFNVDISKNWENSEENKELSPKSPAPQDSFRNFTSTSETASGSFTLAKKEESLSNDKWPLFCSETHGEIPDTKKLTDNPDEPLLDLVDKLVMEGLVCYPQRCYSTSENGVHPLSAIKDEFVKLNRDLEYFADFSESAGPEIDYKCNYSQIDGIVTDPSFDSLREDFSSQASAVNTKISSEKTGGKAENFKSECDQTAAIAPSNENERDASDLKYQSDNASCIKNNDKPPLFVEDEQCKEMGPFPSLNDDDAQAISRTVRDSGSDFEDLHQEFSNFDSCDNLDDLENEIIRSLCSPVLNDPENCDEIKIDAEQISASEKCREIDTNQSEEDEQKPLDDSEEYEAVLEEDQKPDEPPICVARRRLYFPLENITEESNTDEGSLSPYRPLSWDEDSEEIQKTTASLALTGESKTPQTNLELVGGNKLPGDQDESRKKIAESNFVSTNETSEVVIALPPRKAKIFVNVLEVGNLKQTLPDAPPSDVVKDSPDFTETSNNPSEIHKCAEGAVHTFGNSPTVNGSSETQITWDPLDQGPSTTECCEEQIDKNYTSNSNAKLDGKCVVTKTEIILKPIMMNPSESSSSDPNVNEPNSMEFHSHLPSVPPPPPPPPMPTREDLKKVSANTSNCSRSSPDGGSLKHRSVSPVGRSAMMRELEQKFLTRQKMANDLEHITKKIAMEVNKDPTMTAAPSHSDSKTNTVYESAKLSSPQGYLKQNGIHNGTAEAWQRTYSPTSPPKSPAVNITNGSSESRFPKQTVITDQPPPPGAVLVDSKVTVEGDRIHTDRYYALPVKEVLKEKTSTTKFIPAPDKYEGIGPTEEGIPVALRQSVKKENMSDWYKTMYKTLHKIDNEGDTYVIDYTSDSELKKEDKRLSPKRDARIDDAANRSVLSNGPRSPPYPPSANSSVKAYNVKPRSIENYQPGHSSAVNNKENVSKRNFPDLNLTKSSYEVKDGYGSDVSFVKNQNQTNGMNPEDQKVWYRQVQQGGDVPRFGLGKPAPEKPKDPVIGPPPPLPPQPMYSNQPLQYQKVSRPETLPPEYTNNSDNGLFMQNSEVYAQHMRHIIQSELQQRSYRVSSPQNNKPFKKYPERKILAKTLFNFRAETPREISLNKGDLVYVYRELDKNWYEGECDGLAGIFPISYVEVLPPEHTKKNEVREGFGKVMYDFTAHTNVELSAKKGDEVHLIRKVDLNWYEARIRDRKGIIPCSYVNTIQEPGSGYHSPVVSSMLSPRSANDYHSSPISSPSLSTRSLSSNVSPQSQNGYSGLRTKKGSRLIEPVLYRALYRYSPQNADELELLEGDTLFVVEMCDDGWFVGTSVRTGEVGIVPGNYLEKV